MISRFEKPELTESANAILSLLRKDGNMTIDDIQAKTGLNTGNLMSGLLILELRNDAGHDYKRMVYLR